MYKKKNKFSAVQIVPRIYRKPSLTIFTLTVADSRHRGLFYLLSAGLRFQKNPFSLGIFFRIRARKERKTVVHYVFLLYLFIFCLLYLLPRIYRRNSDIVYTNNVTYINTLNAMNRSRVDTALYRRVLTLCGSCSISIFF